jgi:Rps23 Pro-64 3,4-dihydroxylase Tpa1-like proline 4-hydroxylase
MTSYGKSMFPNDYLAAQPEAKQMTREQLETEMAIWTHNDLLDELLRLRAENERLKENLMDAQGEIHYLKNRAEF